jgi:hypothetical protein
MGERGSDLERDLQISTFSLTHIPPCSEGYWWPEDVAAYHLVR